MSQYLTEVINRVSVGALYTMLFLIVIGLVALAFRDRKHKPAATAASRINCPMCGQEVEQ